MADHSQKWHDRAFTRNRRSNTSDGLAAIQAQLNNLGKEIKKVNEKVSGSKPSYSDQQSIVPIVSQTSGRSDNIMECVLHSFITENDPDQDMIYEDFDQVTEVKTDEPKALISVDSMVNWSDHEAENKTGMVEKVYGMMAGLNGDHAGKGVSDAATEFAMMGISPQHPEVGQINHRFVEGDNDSWKGRREKSLSSRKSHDT
nr:hypothetical protein [Tanacetum cinerariifolium]